MSVEFFIVMFVVVIIVLVAISNNHETRKKWESWPTVEQYIDEYNPSKGKGISCHKCGSHNIWETGFGGSKSNLRIHYCKQCKTNLYRT